LRRLAEAPSTEEEIPFEDLLVAVESDYLRDVELTIDGPRAVLQEVLFTQGDPEGFPDGRPTTSATATPTTGWCSCSPAAARPLERRRVEAHLDAFLGTAVPAPYRVFRMGAPERVVVDVRSDAG
jgi:hypothetical protein